MKVKRVKKAAKKQYKCKRTKFLESLRESRSLLETLEIEKVDMNTFDNWMIKYKFFREGVDAIDKEMILFVEHKLIERIKEGDLKAIEMYMKYKGTFSIAKPEERGDDVGITIHISEKDVDKL